MPEPTVPGLSRIAFVAMPFRTRATGLPPGKGPASVDFDALWELGILPALTALGYMPIRADNQTGSVIIKDMLQQLVHADLVLADISIANGNVYYEAGVRHAACAKGCILISAEWAQPLFDLEQITQLRYPLPDDHPTPADYQSIAERLTSGIPRLAESEGPVYSLTRIADLGAADTRHLEELSSVLFEFQTRLRAAKLKARSGDKAALRAFLNADNLERLPGFALRELTTAVRDNLNWGELNALLARFPKSIKEDPYFLEQQALATGKLGHVQDAIALLEQVVEKYGATPERLGTIGGRYRELARIQRSRRRSPYQSKAIESYRRGMQLDLNQYYCAHKLMVTLIERNRAGDTDEAGRCAAHVDAACERAEALHREDEWLASTRLIRAFFVRDLEHAQRRMDEILDRGWANWKLVGLAKDLRSVLDFIESDDKSDFEALLAELQSALPIPQDVLLRDLLPSIRDEGDHFKKSTRVHARLAIEGEVIVSRTDAGEETSNTAREGDMVVKNLTRAEELYLVGREKFGQRYEAVERVDDTWTLYAPLGEIRAVEVTHELTTLLDVGEEFFIVAPWGTEQVVREGDYFVAPLPELGEVYRIARSEFHQTYEKTRGAAVP